MSRVLLVLELFAAFLCYLVAAKLGDLAVLRPAAPIIFPAAALTFAWLLKRQQTPYLSVAFFLAAMTTELILGPHSFADSVVLAIIEVGPLLLIRRRLRDPMDIEKMFDGETNLARFVFYIGMASATMPSLRQVCAWLSGAPWPSFDETTWLARCAAYFIGFVIVTPWLLVLSQERRHFWPRSRQIEAWVLGVLVVIDSFLIYRLDIYAGDNYYPVLFPMLILHTWASLRFGLLGGCNSVAVISFFTIWGTVDGMGLFLRPNLEDTTFILRTYLIWVPLTTLTQGALTSRRDEVERRLRGAIQMLQQAKEGAEKANRLKSQFLANMSHEIRTPITAMLSFNSFLREEDLSAEERLRFVDVISRNGEQLLQIIDDILDLSKIEAGRLQLHWQPVSLRNLLSDLLVNISAQSLNREISLHVDYVAGAPEHITTDPIRLRQILSNLVGNAVKFTNPPGKVVITVRALKAVNAEGHPMLEFEVSDTGCGIAAVYHDQLFEAFMQADPSTTRKYGGTGLGLILARRLARDLGGDVMLITSAPGIGSTFAATIGWRPVPLSELSAVHQTHAREQDDNKGLLPLQGAHILVAEDNEDIQLALKRYLRRAGAQVDSVANGEDAIARALSASYHMIVMDIHMPLLDGHEATRRLREHGYDQPIIVLSAHAMKGEEEKSYDAGCNLHLSKPIVGDELVSVLTQYYAP